MTENPVLFSKMGCISPETLKVLHTQQFTRATPVQHAVIPLFCTNKDVAVDAATGSGKTLSFVVPIAEKLRGVEDALQPHEVWAARSSSPALPLVRGSKL